MNKKISLEEKIIKLEQSNAHSEHLLKILVKGQQEIKSHLYREEKQPANPTADKNIELQKKEAINYINNIVLPDIEAAQAEQKSTEGEIGAQGLTDWLVAQLAQPVFEYLKTQALHYIGEALGELKKQALPLAVQAADWALDKLEDIIVKEYKKATENQQKQFKEEISKTFPNSRLLEKLN